MNVPETLDKAYNSEEKTVRKPFVLKLVSFFNDKNNLHLLKDDELCRRLIIISCLSTNELLYKHLIRNRPDITSNEELIEQYKKQIEDEGIMEYYLIENFFGLF